MAKATAAAKASAPTHSKEQLLRSQRYVRYRDLLGALLKNDERYTRDEVDALIEKTMKDRLCSNSKQIYL